ncbi:MAG: hypothetical protein B5M53_08575 [Candidatus Cloacimonas sp. 4484_209]|nr:MAG: hypothetical protein B5M53_08575 [Candidatus Cloacimonas sp. 4484_209]
MAIAVKCPICGKIKKIRREQTFFRCCNFAFEVAKYKVAESYKKSVEPDEKVTLILKGDGE